MPSVGGGGGAAVTAEAVALQCDSAVAEYNSPKLGQWVGRVQKKYDKFTHRLNVGVEHRQMHRRAPAPKQEQRVKKQASHTVTLKKFQKSFEKYSSCQQNKPKLGCHLTSKMIKIRSA